IELAAFVGVDYLRFYKAIYPFHGVSQLYDTAAHFTELDLGLGHCKRIFVREVAFRNKEDVKNSAF
ncbi:MAG: hypothetical protein SV775_14180, partial [Thermodesulfobacteriota bacterium]|nr:hypothetical protein [Thermodesulfobacteriota bacterium]